MKKLSILKSAVIIPFAAVAASTVAACSKDTTVKVESVSFQDSYYYSETGQTFTNVKVKITPENATDKKVSYSIADPLVAEIQEVKEETGEVVVKGLKQGYTTMQVKTHDGEKTASVDVWIYDHPIPAAGITIVPSSLTIKLGTTKQIAAVITPEGTTVKYANWEVTDGSDKISISSPEDDKLKCNVAAKAAGTAKIKAFTWDGKYSSECTVTVQEDIYPDKVIVSPTTLKLAPNESQFIAASFEPETTTVTETSWASADTSRVIVEKIDDTHAKVTGKKATEAETPINITVTTKNGKTATCAVTVEDKEAQVEKVTFKTDMVVACMESTVEMPEYSVYPTYAKVNKVEWTSEKPEIAMVGKTAEEKWQIQGKSVGKTKITLTVNDGQASATIPVEVVEQGIPISAIKLNTDTLTGDVGASATLKATIDPEYATDREIVWSSSDDNYATVDQKGVVTFKKVTTEENPVTIKVASKLHEDIFATCKVTIKSEPVVPTKIIISPKPTQMSVGEEVALFADVTSANNLTSTDDITWETDKPDCLDVVITGNRTATIKAKKLCEEITVTAKSVYDPSVKDHVTFEIKDPTYVPVKGIKLNIVPGCKAGTPHPFSYTLQPFNGSATNMRVTVTPEENAKVYPYWIVGLKTGPLQVTISCEDEQTHEKFSDTKSITVEADEPLVPLTSKSTNYYTPDGQWTLPAKLLYSETQSKSSLQWKDPTFVNNTLHLESRTEDGDRNRSISMNMIFEINAWVPANSTLNKKLILNGVTSAKYGKQQNADYTYMMTEAFWLDDDVDKRPEYFVCAEKYQSDRDKLSIGWDKKEKKIWQAGDYKSDQFKLAEKDFEFINTSDQPANISKYFMVSYSCDKYDEYCGSLEWMLDLQIDLQDR